MMSTQKIPRSFRASSGTLWDLIGTARSQRDTAAMTDLLELCSAIAQDRVDQVDDVIRALEGICESAGDETVRAIDTARTKLEAFRDGALIDTKRGLVSRYQRDREREWFDAIRADDWDEALRIARAIVPADATESERRDWGVCRRICQQVSMKMENVAVDAVDGPSVIPRGAQGVEPDAGPVPG